MGTQRITVAVDAMGGDKAPDEIVRGALDAVAELGDGVERAADDLARSLVAAHGVDRDGDALRAHVR